MNGPVDPFASLDPDACAQSEPTGILAMATAFDRLQGRIGYSFHDPDLLAQALRHRSVNSPSPQQDAAPPLVGMAPHHNERLEFLGDAVLELVISRMLFQRFADAPEGFLTRSRAALVNTRFLARLAREIELGPCLQMGKGESQSGGRKKNSILGNALEALMGAVYLDGGHEAALALAGRLFGERIALMALGPDPGKAGKDFKSLLQERLQANGHPPPIYRVVGVAGPDHERDFTVACLAQGRPVEEGQGGSKREAERQAARAVLTCWDAEAINEPA